MRSFLFCFLSLLCARTSAAPTDPQLFRSLFAATLEPTSSERIQHLIFAPTPSLFDEEHIYATQPCRSPLSSVQPSETQARYLLCQLNTAFGAVSARQLYEQGLNTPTILPKDELEQLARWTSETDILLVIIPGIFGEFIDQRAFEEIFPLHAAHGSIQNDSAFAREWRAKFAEAQNCSTKAEDESSFCDPQDKLQRMGLQNSGISNVSMQELIHAGSLDDSNGVPEVRAILFQVDGMSLESIGTQEHNAQLFNRRLEKFFKIMGHTPKHIVLIGYSRGTDFALEMLSQARRDQKPWLANVSSMISLGGVVWGSAIADDVQKNSVNAIYQQLRLLSDLRQKLTPLPNLQKGVLSAANGFTFLNNTLAWYRFARAAADLQSKGQESVTDWIKNALQNKKILDPQFLVDLLVSELVNFGLIDQPELTKHYSAFCEALAAVQKGNIFPFYEFWAGLWRQPAMTPEGFDAYTAKYNTDLKRFEKLALAATQAVDELTTDSRLAWWTTHEVPTHVHYYSVAATMADPTTDLGQNSFGYVPGSPDDQSLIKNWQAFQKVTISGEYIGTALNDSQVAVQKTVFWPRLIASLNPKNSGLIATPLGILGTHHWGMTLPAVARSRRLGPNTDEDSKNVNPFPRAALLKTLALAIANDLRENGSK